MWTSGSDPASVESVTSVGVRGGATAPTAFDCTACGACCHAQTPDYIRLYGVDVERLDEGALPLTEPRAGYRVMSFADGRCRALEQDVATGRCRCAIYSRRPDCCRWLEPGSAWCRELRDALVRSSAASHPPSGPRTAGAPPGGGGAGAAR